MKSLRRKRCFLEKFFQKCRFTVEKMVFIRKNRNFNTKTSFSCRKQQFTSKIVLYSGKLSFYQKKPKIFVENDVFQRKFFRNAVLQWIRWFLSGKAEILTRKRGFLVENSSLHLKQYFIVENSVFIRRNRFTVGKMVFIRKSRNFNTKTRFSCRKQQFTSKISTLQWKTQFLSEETEILSRKRCFLDKIFQECRFTVEKMVFIRKNRNFNTKTRFSCRKQQFTSKIVLYSGKLSFYQKKRKVYVENDVFQRKFFRNAVLQWRRWFFIRKSRNFNTKTRFSCRKQQFTSKIVLYSGKLSFYKKKRKVYVENDVFQRKFFRNAVLQ